MADAQAGDQGHRQIDRQHHQPQARDDPMRARQITIAPPHIFQQGDVQTKRRQNHQRHVDIADDIDESVAGRPDHAPDHDSGDQSQGLLQQLPHRNDGDIRFQQATGRAGNRQH